MHDRWLVVLTASMLMTGFATIVESAEFIALRNAFNDGAIFDGTILLSRIKLPRNRVFRSAVSMVFAPIVPVYLSLTCIVAVILACCGILLDLRAGAAVCIGIVIVGRLLRSYRTPYGGDGSDQIVTLVWVGILAELILDVLGFRHSGLGFAFVASQSSLSYLVAGLAKLMSHEWRSGVAVRFVFRTHSYGSPFVYGTLQRLGWLDSALSITIITFECLFPIWVFIPRSTIGVLSIGVVFHVWNAIFMRLNVFLWGFIATYPAIWYCSSVGWKELWRSWWR